MTRRKPLSKRLTILSDARNLTSKQEHQVIAMADRARHLEADRHDLIERSDLARKIVEEHRFESPYAARRECVCGICRIGSALDGPDEFAERLMAEMRKPIGTPAEQAANDLRTHLAIEEMGRRLHDQEKEPS